MALDRRNTVVIGAETVTDGAATDFPGYRPDEDQIWDEQAFREKLTVSIGRQSKLETEFDLVGVDASVANAIRRILIAEVPTVAVEHVYVWNNTSVVQDEVLSQRLGLVPLAIDPKKVEYKNFDEEPTDLNTIVFSLVAKCERNRGAKRDEQDPDKLYTHAQVFSSSFNWQAKGIQNDEFASNAPRPVFDDILLAKLRPNQEILLEMHCEKGIGRDHAKWSPVATASYRLLPTIEIKDTLPSHLCDKLANCFAPGVIRVHDDSDTGTKTAVVVNPRKDTVSREVLRHEDLRPHVSLGRQRDYFIFQLESAGQYTAQLLLPAALEVMLSKVQVLRSALDTL